LLIATAGATALFHTLIPDHWLPFVLVARSQNWSLRKTFLTTLISALFHVVLSLGLGILALYLGREFIVAVGERLELFAGWALAFFGVVYTLYFLVGGGQHQHYFPGHGEHHPHEDYPEGEHEGPSKPHILSRHLGDRPWGALALAAVVGLNPCVLAIPLVFATIAEDRWALVGVSIAFAVTSTVVLVGASILGYKGLQRFRFPFLNKYGEVISGLLLTVVGLLMILLESRH
jgi:ABC-type nickel/cobalt efflux system permease component RcnA